MQVSELKGRAVKDLVLEEGALAHLFEKHGIDYCIHGEESLESACSRKGLAIEEVVHEMERAREARPYSFLHSDLWDEEFLIEYIVENHHRYVKATLPVILTQLGTLVQQSGEQHSSLKLVLLLFQRAAREIEQHMRKEEMILFPYIKSLASAAEFGRRRPMAPFVTIDGPLVSMQDEHLEIEQALAKIRALLSDYHAPSDATLLHRTFISAMQAFTKDMHQHIHLENNLLFPRARVLEALFDVRTGQLRAGESLQES